MDKLMQIPLPLIDGGINFRAVGGGIKPGLLYRSGAYDTLTPAGRAQLQALGPITLFDLRAAGEQARQPLPQFDDGSVDHVAFVHDMHIADLTRILRDPGSTPQHSREAMLHIYRELPNRFVPIYQQMFRHMAVTDRAVVINCTAGKDRTGVAVALLLGALGQSRDAILADYLETNRSFDVIKTMFLRRRVNSGAADMRPEVIDPVLRADPDYLAAMFDTLDAVDGGLHGYLTRTLGQSEADLDRLRARFQA